MSNGREPRSCLGWVFKFKLGRFVPKQFNCLACTQRLLELKTWSRFHLISRSCSCFIHLLKVGTGNPYWSRMLSMVDLLVKIACFVRKKKYFFCIKATDLNKLARGSQPCWSFPFIKESMVIIFLMIRSPCSWDRIIVWRSLNVFQSLPKTSIWSQSYKTFYVCN